MNPRRICRRWGVSGSSGPSAWAAPDDVARHGRLPGSGPKPGPPSRCRADRCPGARGASGGTGVLVRQDVLSLIPPLSPPDPGGWTEPGERRRPDRAGPPMDGGCGEWCRVVPRPEGPARVAAFVRAARSTERPVNRRSARRPNLDQQPARSRLSVETERLTIGAGRDSLKLLFAIPLGARLVRECPR